MQPIVMLATHIFNQYISALVVNAQQFWISIKTATHGMELELHFFNK